MADLQIHLGPLEALEPGLHAVRDRVFIEEQNIPRTIEWDGSDATCTHVLITDGPVPIACGRIDAQGHIGRVAVVADRRHQGLGAMVIKHLEAVAQKCPCRQTTLSSQTSATGFYEKLGYKAMGQVFEEAGIPHQKMIKPL